MDGSSGRLTLVHRASKKCLLEFTSRYLTHRHMFFFHHATMIGLRLCVLPAMDRTGMSTQYHKHHKPVCSLGFVCAAHNELHGNGRHRHTHTNTHTHAHAHTHRSVGVLGLPKDPSHRTICVGVKSEEEQHNEDQNVCGVSGLRDDRRFNAYNRLLVSQTPLCTLAGLQLVWEGILAVYSGVPFSAHTCADGSVQVGIA